MRAQPPTNRTCCLSGMVMGLAGAALWATLLSGIAIYIGGESWRSQGIAIYTTIMVVYMTLVVAIGLVPLGLLIGWQLPRRLIGLRPWAAFSIGGYVGSLAGLLTVFGLAGFNIAQAGWGATKDFIAFYLFTLPPVTGIWTGLWTQRWRDARPQSFVAGWLYWDANCPFCTKWVGRFAFIARQGGFELVPLQSDATCRDLGLREGELPSEMKLRLADGRLLGGVDAYIELAEAAGWTAPLGWL
ncbi:MAG: thiol-disulfide oxidoreductase DCC family protein, partial [Limisphaerales bacterium]